VAVKLSGIVAELRKNIGDPVEKDEVVAILESREVADAKSEYLAARLTNESEKITGEIIISGDDDAPVHGRTVLKQRSGASSFLVTPSCLPQTVACTLIPPTHTQTPAS
jgi:multidrug efflux pump subunit AcrA (membrane-fusion protein)